MPKTTSINQRKYDTSNCKGIYLKLSIKYDSDILDKLEEIGNKQGYIKELIRKDIKKEDH